MPNHLILCRPLLLFPSICSSIRFFAVSQFFTWGGQSISFSFSITPSMNIQSWFPLGLTGLISFLSKGLSGVFSSTTIRKHQILVLSLLYGSVVKKPLVNAVAVGDAGSIPDSGDLMAFFSHSVASDSDPMDCRRPGVPTHHRLPSLLKFMSLRQGCHLSI